MTAELLVQALFLATTVTGVTALLVGWFRSRGLDRAAENAALRDENARLRQENRNLHAERFAPTDWQAPARLVP